MVCLYCGKKTHVTNSRFQPRTNGVWRRRQCTACGATFTSVEAATYERSLAIQVSTSHVVPFHRDRLFLSIYNACRHRPTAISDATALTDTIITRILRSSRVRRAMITRDDLVSLAAETLAKFDNAAGVQYSAFHPFKRPA